MTVREREREKKEENSFTRSIHALVTTAGHVIRVTFVYYQLDNRTHV